MSQSLPVNYGIIIFPGFQALDAFGTLDILNTLAWSQKLNLSIIASTLDPVSTAPPNKTSSFCQSIVPTHTFVNPPPALDVLIVPGGNGVESPLLDAIAYIRDVYPSLKYLMSVCNGATLLARAGMLDGRRATTTKALWAPSTATGPNVIWVPTARWVVDGNIWTSSGVAAGMDSTFAFVGAVYGETVATELANLLEYERNSDPSRDPFAAIWKIPGA